MRGNDNLFIAKNGKDLDGPTTAIRVVIFVVLEDLIVQHGSIPLAPLCLLD